MTQEHDDGRIADRYRPTTIRDDITARHVAARDLTPQQATEIIALQVEAYGGRGWSAEPNAKDHLMWLMRDRPSATEFVLLEREGVIVGTHFLWQERCRIHDRVWRIRSGGNHALSASLQGQGILRIFTTYLRESAHPDTELMFGHFSHALTKRTITANRRIFGAQDLELLLPLDARRLGVASAHATDVRGRSRTIESMTRAARRIPRWRLLATQVWRWRKLRSRVQAARAARSSPQPDVVVRELSRFDDRFPAFLERATAPFELIRERTLDYLNWRYCDPRGGQYTVLIAEDGDEVLGYLALSAVPPMTAIADILTEPERPDVVRALVDEAVTLSRAQHAAGVRCWMAPNHAYLSSLKANGFIERPQETVLAYELYRGLQADVAPLDDPDLKIHLVLGDTDHV